MGFHHHDPLTDLLFPIDTARAVDELVRRARAGEPVDPRIAERACMRRGLSRRFGGFGRRGERGRRFPAGGPAWLLDYRNATTTRSSVAAYQDLRNGWAFASLNPDAYKAADEPRIFSDGAILVEESRTNLCSESWDLSAWTVSAGATTTGGQDTPDGGSDGYRITDANAAGYSYVFTPATATAAGDHAYSLFVLKDSDETRFPEFQVVGNTGTLTGGTVGVQINTKTGATSTRVGTPTSVDVIDEGSWWRLIVVVEVATTGTFDLRLYPAIGSGLGTASTSAQGSATVWGVQFEEGVFSTSYIPTSGGSETRAEDQPVVALADVPPSFLSVGFRLDFWAEWDSTQGSIFRRLFYFDTSRSLSLDLSGTGTRWYLKTPGGNLSTAKYTWSAGDKVTVGVKWSDYLTTWVNDVHQQTVDISTVSDWSGASTDLQVGYGVSTNAAVGRPRSL